MIKFYFNTSPNPMKVALCLEEMALPYEPVVIDTRKGDQFAPGFAALNPNAKVPVIVDGDVTVFDSNAILLYLSEKTGLFGPGLGAKERSEFLSWLMFVATGVGPFSGQAVHFKHFAPEQVPYANTRYQYEADRHYTVADRRLADRPYLAGGSYTVADMALWGWARMVPFILGDEAWARYPNLKRLFDEISSRPAAKRAEEFRAKHASAFKAEMDDEARAVMFKHLKSA
ncbi:glutathione S-transferase family protein [Enterovirga aerilata]|uniref:Glutathione S-transferase family protein n=1 Tax=Enterovirga aerilata TaxID=2730920 RepID=A0A849IAT5_9HYPH|nr:glutathione S-transferase N-terminal domain-containing protein [Enterovirga sp. DB1703]NNM74518.1 glutathione S-transferase family protein [Enterovirga sp. DB1703]